MNIQSLEYFLELCRQENFTEASYHCNMTQSALSKQIRKLENEVGTALIRRNTRDFELTQEGLIFQEYAAHAAKLHRDMLDRIGKKEIRLGSMPVLSPYHFAKVIVAFQEQYRDEKIYLEERPTGEILENMDEFDFVILRSCLIEGSSDYESFFLYDDLICAVLPVSHPLAGEKMISLRDLRNEEFIFPAKGTGGYEFFLKSCESVGFTPNIRYEFPQANTVISFVKERMGITLTFLKIYEENSCEEICMVPLQEKFHYPISFAYSKKKKLTFNQKRFVNFVRGMLQENLS